MWRTLSPWIFRGQPLITVFSAIYRREWNRRLRKFRLVPSGEAPVPVEPLTAYEVGQLLGGN